MPISIGHAHASREHGTPFRRLGYRPGDEPPCWVADPAYKTVQETRKRSGDSPVRRRAGSGGLGLGGLGGGADVL
ncbi:MAG TPA: hypothetical protein VFT74_19710, partial [Isosphaeraceae bacterium]|nr:hypothetical protein [Isosphaeraceae bacterium]